MKRINRALAITIYLCIFISSNAFCQKFKSISSSVHFFSEAPMEDIEATNADGQSAFDIGTGEIVFSIPIKSFIFEKSLMQEHFNENYLESDKFPKATFTGKVESFDPAFSTQQPAVAKGSMKIHGIEQEISVEGKLKFTESTIELNTKFPIRLEDYKIKIPKVVFYNIAEVVEVTIKFDYEPID